MTALLYFIGIWLVLSVAVSALWWRRHGRPDPLWRGLYGFLVWPLMAFVLVVGIPDGTEFSGNL